GLSAISCSPIAQGGTMAPADTTQCSATYTVTQADVDAGQIDNTGTATGTPPSGPDVTDDDPLSEPVAQDPAIEALKENTDNDDADMDGNISTGDTLTYTITATNIGNVTLNNVTVDDDLTGTTDAPCASSLAPTASCSVDVFYTVQVDDRGQLPNLGTVTGQCTHDDCPVSDTDPEVVLVFGDVCENFKPTSLTMQYTGVSNDDHSQTGSEAFTLGDSMGIDPAYVIVKDHKGRTQFEGFVFVEGIFSFGGSRKRIAPRHTIFTYTDNPKGNNGGELKETTQFHTSCSQPLEITDQYGSYLLINSTE
ncbi:MAG: hypothetical protein V7731_04380, partial [Amphritea sp.]